MNAREITYGIEIECLIPRALIVNHTVPVGSRHNGIQVPTLPAGWNAQDDGSVGSSRRDMRGVEIVSPILKGDDGLRQIQRVCEQLKAWGAETNTTCGFHVHVGWAGDKFQLNKLVHLVANFERAIYASTGTKSREAGSYCRPIRHDFRNLNLETAAHPHQIDAAAHDRFHSLNISNILSGRSTVEFRAFAGTLNFSKIVGHIQTCVGLVEQSLNTARAASWESKRESAKVAARADKTGRIALTRLFYQLGWIKGRTDKVWGNITEDAAEFPDLKTIKKTLMGLAKKYDKGGEE